VVRGIAITSYAAKERGAAPDPESDHHLLIIDRSTNTEYGMWDFAASNGVYTCGLGATQDLNGSGVRPLADVANPWWQAHGPRACGFGLIAGLIRPEEIAAGVIEHALIVAYPHIRSGFFVPPASTAQASNGSGAEPNRGIPSLHDSSHAVRQRNSNHLGNSGFKSSTIAARPRLRWPGENEPGWPAVVRLATSGRRRPRAQ
jgi:hypothetical protein